MEHPTALLERLQLGREEYCQRLLTMLILDGPYPPWNSTSTPSPHGREFLAALEELCFGSRGPLEDAAFVDELDLGRRPEDLQGSSPDYGVFTTDRLWIIELKTERGSHRDAQIPTYTGTARHRFPDRRVDVTYLTGPLPTYRPDLPGDVRFAHVTWDDVLPLVHRTWGGGTQAQRTAVSMLETVLTSLGAPWTTWRAARLAPHPTTEPRALAGTAIRETARDHQQRGLEHDAGSLEELRALGRELRSWIAEQPDPALAHVRPWLWNVATSGGVPLTDAGAEVGYELRFSWYADPVG